MASKLEFDSPSPAAERKLEFDSPPPVAPAGPPSVPISGPQNHEAALAAANAPASVPISQGNIDTRGMKEDPKITAQKQREGRVQAIADALRAKENPTGVADFVADKFSLGTTRPPTALANALLMRLQGQHPDTPFAELYQGSDRYMNDRMSRAEDKTGPLAPMVGAVASLPASMALSGAGKVAGAPAAVTPGVRATASAPASTLKVMADAAKPGFVEGAASNAETLDSAVTGGAKNAALSAGVAGAADKVTQYALPAARRGAAAEAQAAKGVDPDSMSDAAGRFFTQMDNAGVRYNAQQTAPLYQSLHDMRNAARYDADANPTLRGHFDRLLNLSRNEMSYTELQNLRSAVADQTRSPDPSTRRAAGEILGNVDRVIRGVPAVNPQGLDMDAMHREAGRLWRGSNLAADIDYRAGKGGRALEAGKDVNPDAKMRDDLFNYRERTRAPRAYNPLGEEGNTANNLLDRAIEGTGGQNFKRSAGDFLVKNAKGAGAIAGAGTTAVGLTHGNAPGYALLSSLAGVPVAAASHLSGKVLQRSAAGARGQDVDALLREITGSPKLPKGAAISRDDLAKILFSQDLERIAPRVGSAAIGEHEDPKKKKEKEKAR